MRRSAKRGGNAQPGRKSGIDEERRVAVSARSSSSFISVRDHGIARFAQPNGQWSRASNRLQC
jgi:hypothetical protein